MTASATLWAKLGYAGVLPLLISWLASALLPSHALWPQVFVAYSAIILAFMAGSVWTQALNSPQGAPLLLLSNALALLAWLTLLLDQPTAGTALLALGFAVLWWAERRGKGFSQLPAGYARLRSQLSSAVIALHLLQFPTLLLLH
ncbi:DUF3429 domain-containing protein [Atopomonas sediminilitoris]|uniref:DUF3429 domain-containing protein n=1 Tax=Atopomonas sediminilitoris TaxID=2919919 RepID=UPI001F4D5C9C|nr:DUF3429 domain-containing protein [Atopomonas sediminilitoris]MCJ8169684.1 DUF3429 domain-containing protein [Atopomonas sediminilitoris]